MNQRRLRLTTIGPLIISSILIIVFAAIYVISSNAEYSNIQESLDDVSRPILTTTSSLLFNPVYNLDVTRITAILDPYVDGTSLIYAAVYNTTGTQLVEINKKWAPDAAISHDLSVLALEQSTIVKKEVDNYLILTQAIAVGTEQIGTVEIVFDQAPLRTSLGKAQTTISITLVVALIAVTLLFFILFQFAARPLERLALVAQDISHGNLSATIPSEGLQEISFLASALIALVDTVRNTISTLEERVADRTKALTTSTEVSRRLSTILDQKRLAVEVVEQLQSAFNYYHAHIYILSETGDELLMVGGTGEAGQLLQARGHKIPKGKGLVGRAAETKEIVLVPDTTQDPGWLPNPLLPETKSEIAVPIVAGEEVLGVLDVQNNLAGSLGQQDADLLRAIADQVAIAIQNSRLYERAEASIQETQSLLEYAPEAIVVVNLETGLFTDPNANAEKLYGLSRGDLLKVGPAQMSPPTQPDGRDSLEKAMEKIGEAMQGGAPIFDWTHRNAQGEDIPCEVRLLRIPGARPRVRASVTDISERKKAESALLESEIRLRTLIENAPEAIAVVDISTGLFTQPNENAVRLYGLSREELVKVGPAQMSPPTQPDGRDSTEKAMERIGEAMQGGAPVFEWTHRNAQGRDIPCEVRLVRLPSERPLVRASVTDITQRKRDEELTIQRAKQLETVAAIATASSTLLDPGKLLQTVTNLTKERFDLYHAHVYLLDESAANLVLASGAGEVGKKMIAEGFSIHVSAEKSLVAQAARDRRAVIVNDVRGEPTFLPNPLLPETRSEMAVPLIAGDTVLGVLDVQSDQVDHFTQEDINIQTTLAAQIAIALQNARTLSQVQHQAERETMLNAIGQKIQSAKTVEAVLQIAARELGHALGAPLTIAQLGIKGNGNGSHS